jgi:hypothetical protein
MEPTMPNWVGLLLALIVLVGFISFALTPDKDNPDNLHSGGGGQSTGDGSHHGGDGHF